jgi:tRNA-splicing ligase RtcB
MATQRFERVGPVTYETPRGAGEGAPARIFADEVLFEQISRDHSIEQLLNVATLPGVVGHVLGMPDMHEGYGFPVGGVAATALPDGIISPGGIGFDINCGVRLLTSRRTRGQIGDVERLVHELMRSIPAGFGRHGRLELTERQMDDVLVRGAGAVVEGHGLGREDDLERTEARGCLDAASSRHVSDRAKQRGRDQLGTLGGGNHFLEVQVVESIHDADAASVFGLFEGQVTVLLHTGSRGLGHQVCADHVRVMDEALGRHGIVLPDRQLACAPLSSTEGRAYFGAMCAAANFAWANRQVLTQRVREAFRAIVGDGDLRLVYDVAHNIAKIEEYGARRLCVHRKGATRALGPGHRDIPAAYRKVGQPVLIPGSMGTASFVLVGCDAAREIALASACHGAGRAMSRTAAKKQVQGAALRRALEAQGIVVRCPSNAELAEEAPAAYKDIERVVAVIERAGIARRVARLRPVGVVKG